jgi:hypothetical protein
MLHYHWSPPEYGIVRMNLFPRGKMTGNPIIKKGKRLTVNKLVVIALLVLTLAGCGDGRDDSRVGSELTAVDWTGTWSGTVTEAAFGTNTATLSVVQSGTTITGTYSSRYSTGSVSGSVSGNVVSITMSAASCTGMMYGSAKVTTRTAGRQEMAFTASGTYACSNQIYDNTITGTLIKQ